MQEQVISDSLKMTLASEWQEFRKTLRGFVTPEVVRGLKQAHKAGYMGASVKAGAIIIEVSEGRMSLDEAMEHLRDCFTGA